MAYGQTRAEAVAKAEALVLRILADKLEHGEWSLKLLKYFRCQHECVGRP